MGLIYCGIDEAGYGPLLGPLCVGFSAFRVAQWDPAAGAPDLWKLLNRAVCRDGGDKRRRIAVADSKKLKLSNQLKTKHPLTHLERGVLSFAGLLHCGAGFQRCGAGFEPASASGLEEEARAGRMPVPHEEAGRMPAPQEKAGRMPAPQEEAGRMPAPQLDTDAGLFAALGVRLEPHGWYGGEAVGLPLACTDKQIAIARNKVALACEGASVEPVALACIAVGEREFNEVVRTGGSKGHVTGHTFVRYMRRVAERWGSGTDEVRVVCDSHGGRTSYSGMIEAAVRGLGLDVEILEETDRCSRYRVGERIGVLFRPEAEDSHLPVALASMTAKLVRELTMARFNRYWCARMPDLKPTAGYTLDARRWLQDAKGALLQIERETMVRMA